MNHVNLRNVVPFEFGGLMIRDPALASLTSASVALIDVPPGVSHPKAKSVESDKLYVCVSGALAFTVGGTRIALETSDLLVIPRGEWFGYENRGESTATVLLVHVPPFNLESEVFDT
ncbi:MAG: cupin domain-containing protein [Chloroflexi bacterium]|nr:cupin domain-containing protein [Chloroflexota bacterium]